MKTFSWKVNYMLLQPFHNMILWTKKVLLLGDPTYSKWDQIPTISRRTRCSRCTRKWMTNMRTFQRPSRIFCKWHKKMKMKEQVSTKDSPLRQKEVKQIQIWMYKNWKELWIFNRRPLNRFKIYQEKLIITIKKVKKMEVRHKDQSIGSRKRICRNRCHIRGKGMCIAQVYLETRKEIDVDCWR